MSTGALVPLAAATLSFNITRSVRFEAWLLPVFLAAGHGLSGWLIEKKVVPTNASRVALYVTLPLAFAVL